MPPSDVSLKRSRKVPETVFFSNLRSWLRLTNPMMRLEQRKQLSGPPASLLPGLGRGSQIPSLALPLTNCPTMAMSLRSTDSLRLPGWKRCEDSVPYKWAGSVAEGAQAWGQAWL